MRHANAAAIVASSPSTTTSTTSSTSSSSSSSSSSAPDLSAALSALTTKLGVCFFRVRVRGRLSSNASVYISGDCPELGGGKALRMDRVHKGSHPGAQLFAITLPIALARRFSYKYLIIDEVQKQHQQLSKDRVVRPVSFQVVVV